MPIGRFASASRLLVKSLRNYDESGLLPAAFVDPRSGYRYYRIEQLATAGVIRSLRLIDMPLAAIAAILRGDEPEPLLTSHLASLMSGRELIDRKIGAVKRLLSSKDSVMTNNVNLKMVAAQTVARYRTKATHDQIFTSIPNGFGIVFASLQGQPPIGAPFTIFHVFPDAETEGEISLCVPIESHSTSSANVDVIQFGGGLVASIVHQGPYEEMGVAYSTIGSWIHEHGHHVSGSSREVYLNSPTEVEQDGLLTEIQWPIDPHDLPATE